MWEHALGTLKEGKRDILVYDLKRKVLSIKWRSSSRFRVVQKRIIRERKRDSDFRVVEQGFADLNSLS